MNNGIQIPESVHEMLFREFMDLGGMPEVVADFVEYKGFTRVTKIQEEIFAEYQDYIK